MFGSRMLLIITMVAIGGLLVMEGSFSRTYVGETDILVLPKNLQTANDAERIISDAEKIPQALRFYDILLKETPDIQDRLAGMTDAERKAGWNARLAVERSGKSGVLSVKVADTDQSQAELLSQRTAEDIVAVMSRYYDTVHDLDTHIMDGTTVAPAGGIFGFDGVTVAGSALFIIGIVLLILSSNRTVSAAVPYSAPVTGISGALSANTKESVPRAVITATEDEIRDRLNKLLERKI